MKGYRSIVVNVLTGVTLLLAHPDVLSIVPLDQRPTESD
jgi:hypothetical protein